MNLNCRLLNLILILFLAVNISCEKEKLIAIPLLKTGDPTDTAARSATITGEILDVGEGIEQYGHCYSLSVTPTVENTKTEKGGTSSKISFSSELTNLEAGQNYLVRAYAISQGKEYYSETKTIQTLSGRAEVITGQTGVVTHKSAECSGNVTFDGGDQVSERGICWGTTTDISVQNNLGSISTGSGTGTFSVQVENLEPGKKYYYRAWAKTSVTVSYGDAKEFTTKSGEATITTTQVSELKINSAKTGGNVTSDGGVPVTERGICWSLNPNPEVTGNKITSGEGTGSFNILLPELDPGTDYYARAYAINEVDVFYGNQIDFQTLSGIISIKTYAADAVTEKSAILKGEVIDDGGSPVTERGFYWSSTNLSPDAGDNILRAGSGKGSYSATLTAINPNTDYYFLAYAKNESGTRVGEVKTFKTKVEVSKATVTTTSVTIFTSTSAIMGGNVTSDGNATVTEKGVVYSTSPNPTIDTNKIPIGTGKGSFSKTVTGLTPNINYYVRAYAINSQGPGYGDQVSFITDVALPTVTTAAITSVSSTSAIGGGNVTNAGGSPVTARGVVWSTTQNPTVESFQGKTTNGTGTGSFTSQMTGLQTGVTYYVRAYAINSKGPAYGTQVSFKTDAALPTVTTAGITSVSSTSATGGGNVTSTGGSSVTARGVVWSTTQNPTVESNLGKTTNGTGTGSFTSQMTGLQPGVSYYVRAYAINSQGPAYGTQVSFKTEQNIQLASVNTLTTQNISNHGASLRAEVTSDGNSTVTARGFYLSSVNPSPNDNDEVYTVGSGTGSFSEFVTTLQPNTKYYVKAWAKNSAGTNTGSTVNFTTPEDEPFLSKVHVFTDEFSNNNNSWYINEYVDDLGYQVRYEIVNGRYEISWNRPPGWFKYTSIEISTINGYFEIEVRLRTFKELEENPLSGIYFENSQYRNFFYFNKNKDLLFFKDNFSTGERTQYPGKSDYLNNFGIYSTVKIACVQGKYIIYINGKKGIEITDATDQLTRIGFITGRSESHFDNIRVYRDVNAKSSSVIKSGRIYEKNFIDKIETNW
jgi:hypothetical protein